MKPTAMVLLSLLAAAPPALAAGIGDNAQRVPASRLNRHEVADIQAQLAEDGYHVARRDGRLDAETLNALEHFQIDRQLADTAFPDHQTVAALGVPEATQTGALPGRPTRPRQ